MSVVRKSVLLLLLFFLGTRTIWADRPASPHTYITAAFGGGCYFLMKPNFSEGSRYDDGQGIAYEVQPDGSSKELWRTEGWYSFEVFLSMDGRYLVRMGPWNGGHEPRPDHLAVAFYKEGKLLRQYSTAELVKDKSKVQASVSHYVWLSRDDFNALHAGKADPDNGPELGWGRIFRLRTIDGIAYAFDITTGEIVKQPATKN